MDFGGAKVRVSRDYLLIARETDSKRKLTVDNPAFGGS
jgi:hypothetical protein